MSELWQRIRAAFLNLSMRERILVSLAGLAAVALVLMLAVVQPALAAGRRARDRVEAAEFGARRLGAPERV